MLSYRLQWPKQLAPFQSIVDWIEKPFHYRAIAKLILKGFFPLGEEGREKYKISQDQEDGEGGGGNPAVVGRERHLTNSPP